MLNVHRRRREKVFGPGRAVPLDRNAKVRVMTLARALSRPTEPGKAYGELSAKFLSVLEALVWGFHNAATGRCYPSYERIAERAGCARSTVYEAIKALERVGLLSWVNRLVRIREIGPDLFGKARNRWRVIRTSNAYVLIDPQARRSRFASKSETRGETADQDLKLKPPIAATAELDSSNPLHRALLRLKQAQEASFRNPFRPSREVRDCKAG